MGAFSSVIFPASRENVNVQLRKSKPYLVTLPLVAMGDGRTKASAARYPGVDEISADDLEGAEDIEGVLRVSLMVVGATGVWGVAERLSEKAGEPRLSEIVDSEGEAKSLGFGGWGRLWSSTEWIERSSPFQRSPHW